MYAANTIACMIGVHRLYNRDTKMTVVTRPALDKYGRVPSGLWPSSDKASRL